MLVERKSFDLSRESGKDALRKHYAAVIAERHGASKAYSIIMDDFHLTGPLLLI
jgi:hypothetical protein